MYRTINKITELAAVCIMLPFVPHILAPMGVNPWWLLAVPALSLIGKHITFNGVVMTAVLIGSMPDVELDPVVYWTYYGVNIGIIVGVFIYGYLERRWRQAEIGVSYSSSLEELQAAYAELEKLPAGEHTDDLRYEARRLMAFRREANRR